MAIAILISICLPAFIAVAGAIWYQRMVWQQYYGLKTLEEAAVSDSKTLEEEEDDVNTNGLTRLVAHFNRRNHGRLRQLINFINTQM